MSAVLSSLKKFTHDSFDSTQLRLRQDQTYLANFFEDKYTPAIIDNLICEVDLHVSKADLQELLFEAENAHYDRFHDFLSLAKVDLNRPSVARKFYEKLKPLHHKIFSGFFLKVGPGEIIRPHSDPVRGTSLYLPLFGPGHFTPLEIYYQDKKYAITQSDNLSFYAWNTSKLHAVYNHQSSDNRYTFQFSLNCDYQEALHILKNSIGLREAKDCYLRYNVKSYFTPYVGSWSQKKVLDWGCNHGNFLEFDDAPINYTGCDINSTLVQKNAKKWPQHTWLSYQHFNRQYSPSFVEEGPWPLTEQYDVILAFSVYTHTDQHELLEAIQKLKQHLKPGGQLLISFFSTSLKDSWLDIENYRYEYFHGNSGLWNDISRSQVAYVSVDTEGVHFEANCAKSEKSKCKYFVSFYDDSYLQKITGGIVHPQDSQLPSKVLRGQKCLEIKK